MKQVFDLQNQNSSFATSFESENQRRRRIDNLIGTMGASSLGGMSFAPNRIQIASHPQGARKKKKQMHPFSEFPF